MASLEQLGFVSPSPTQEEQSTQAMNPYELDAFLGLREEDTGFDWDTFNKRLLEAGVQDQQTQKVYQDKWLAKGRAMYQGNDEAQAYFNNIQNTQALRQDGLGNFADRTGTAIAAGLSSADASITENLATSFRDVKPEDYAKVEAGLAQQGIDVSSEYVQAWLREHVPGYVGKNPNGKTLEQLDQELMQREWVGDTSQREQEDKDLKKVGAFEAMAEVARDNRLMAEYNSKAKSLLRYSRDELMSFGLKEKDLANFRAKPEQLKELGLSEDTDLYLLTQEQEANIRKYLMNLQAANTVGLSERRKQLEEIDKLQGMAYVKALKEIGIQDIGDFIVQGSYSTASQAPEMVVSMATGGVTGKVGSVLLANALTNFRIDEQQAIADYIDRESKKRGWDPLLLSADQLQQLRDDGVKNGALPEALDIQSEATAARVATELATGFATEGIAEMLGKAKGPKAVQLMAKGLKHLLRAAGEPVEEVNGDLAYKVVEFVKKNPGKPIPWDEMTDGMTQTALGSIFTGENLARGAARLSGAVQNKMQSGATDQQSTVGQDTTLPPVQTNDGGNQRVSDTTPNGELPTVSEPTDNQTPTDRQEPSTQPPSVTQGGETASTADTFLSSLPQEDQRQIARYRQLEKEWDEEFSRWVRDSGLEPLLNSPQEASRLADEFRSTTYRGQEISNEMASIESGANFSSGNFADVYGDYIRLLDQDNNNASGTTNRPSTQNADGSIDNGRVTEPNGAGQTSSNQAGTGVQTTETETPPTGYNQPDTKPVTDTTQQPFDNSPTSDTTGVSGRTGQTDGSGVVGGESTAPRSQEPNQPEQTSSVGGQNTTAPEPQAGYSDGKTLAPTYSRNVSKSTKGFIGKTFADVESLRATVNGMDITKIPRQDVPLVFSHIGKELERLGVDDPDLQAWRDTLWKSLGSAKIEPSDYVGRTDTSGTWLNPETFITALSNGTLSYPEKSISKAKAQINDLYDGFDFAKNKDQVEAVKQVADKHFANLDTTGTSQKAKANAKHKQQLEQAYEQAKRRVGGYPISEQSVGTDTTGETGNVGVEQGNTDSRPTATDSSDVSTQTQDAEPDVSDSTPVTKPPKKGIRKKPQPKDSIAIDPKEKESKTVGQSFLRDSVAKHVGLFSASTKAELQALVDKNQVSLALTVGTDQPITVDTLIELLAKGELTERQLPSLTDNAKTQLANAMWQVRYDVDKHTLDLVKQGNVEVGEIIQLGLTNILPPGKVRTAYKKLLNEAVKFLQEQTGYSRYEAVMQLGGLRRGGGVAAGSYSLSTREIELNNISGVAYLLSTAHHEFGHRMIDVLLTDGREQGFTEQDKKDDHRKLMLKFKTNPFIQSLVGRGMNAYYFSGGIPLMVEEILVDLHSAYKTGSWKQFAERYNIQESDIPQEFKQNKDNILTRTYEALKGLVQIILNKEKLSDKDVADFIKSLGAEKDLNRDAIVNKYLPFSLTYIRAAVSNPNKFTLEGLTHQQATELLSEVLSKNSNKQAYLDAIVDVNPDYLLADAERNSITDNLQQGLATLRKVFSGAVATVSLATMAVPTDALAQQGVAQYQPVQQMKGLSQQASDMIGWVVKNGDHQGKNFVVADKDAGKLYVLDTKGKVVYETNALFGKDKAEAIGGKNTPSGRFLLSRLNDLTPEQQKQYGKDVLGFAETNGSVYAIHRMINVKGQDRASRLASATASDNFISNGCINVPTAFYDTVVDGLDNAMVYVLPHKQTSVTAAAPNKPLSSGASVAGAKGPMSSGAKPLSRHSLSQVKTGLTWDKTQAKLDKVLGPLAKKVNLITADFVAPENALPLSRSGIEGFYDPDTQQVYIVADNIFEQNGLTAEERLAWVAYHELTHAGLDTKYGADLKSVLAPMRNNPFVMNLAKRIQAERERSPYATDELVSIEEALAEINAALQSNKLQHLADRYGVALPMELGNSFVKRMFGNLLSNVRKIVAKVLGKSFITNSQVIDLLKGLPETPDVRETPSVAKISEMLNEMLDDPTSDFNQSVRFSVLGQMSNVAHKVTDAMFHPDTIENYAHGAGRTYQDSASGYNERTNDTQMTLLDKWVEGLIDSMRRVEKIVGTASKAWSELKLAANKANQAKRAFMATAKELEQRMEKLAREHSTAFGAKGKQHRSKITDTLQDATAALYALTGGNAEIRKSYTDVMEDKFDSNGNLIKKGLKTQYAEIEVAIQDALNNGEKPTAWQLRQFQQIGNKIREYEGDANTMGFIKQFDSKVNEEVPNDPTTKSRQDMRFLNGKTNKEAFIFLQKMVADGIMQVTYDGVDISQMTFDQIKQDPYYQKNLAIDLNKLEIKGEFADLVNDYAKFQQKVYKYQVDNLGYNLVGHKSNNPFAVPTRGKVEGIQATHDPITGKVEFTSEPTLQQQIDLAKALEYSNERAGRAFSGVGAIEQMQMAIDLAVKRVAYQQFGHELYDQHKAGNDKIMVTHVGNPLFEATQGILIEVEEKDSNGNLVPKMVKVSFKDPLATQAMLGQNRTHFDIDKLPWGLSHIVSTMKWFNTWASYTLTASPVFAVANAKKGFTEKMRQLSSWSKDNHWVQKMSAKGQALFEGLSSPAKLDLYLNKVGIEITAKRGLTYTAAAEVFALKMTNTPFGKATHDALYKKLTVEQKKAYAKLQQIADDGGLSSRMENLLAERDTLHKRFKRSKATNYLLDKSGNLLENITVTTMAMEYVSTLVTVEILEGLGMPTHDAIAANLEFMNFNDVGASGVSSYLRQMVNFANAVAQGQRGLIKSIFKINDDGTLGMSENGMKSFGYGIAKAVALHSLYLLLGKAIPNDCPDELGNPVVEANSYGLMREHPVVVPWTCSIVRMPVAYGMSMIENAIGVAAVQTFKGDWSMNQAAHHIWEAIKDNANVVPLPVGNTEKNNIPFFIEMFFPFQAKSYARMAQGIDDFGNDLNRKYLDDNIPRHLQGKANTNEFWKMAAKGLFGLGLNYTPEETKAFFSMAIPGWFGDIGKTLLEMYGKGEIDVGGLAYSVTGAKAILRKEQEPYTVAYREVENRLDKYDSIYKTIKEARATPIKPGSKQKELSAMNQHGWLRKQSQFSEFDREVAKLILEMERKQDKWQGKPKSDKKSDSQYKINVDFINKLNELEERYGERR